MEKVVVKITGYVPGNAVGDVCGLAKDVAEAAIKAGVAAPVKVKDAKDKQVGNASTKTVQKG